MKKLYTGLSWLLSVLLILVLGALLYELYVLNILPVGVFWPVAGIFVCITAGVILLLLGYVVRRWAKIVLMLVVLALGICYGTGAFYFFKTYNMLDTVTALRDKNVNTVSLVVLKDSGYDSLEDLEGKKVAALSHIDSAGTEAFLAYCEETLEKEDPFDLERVDSVPGEAAALYAGDVDGIILNEAYRSNILDLEGYEDFDAKTVVVASYSYETEAENEALAVSDITTKPFNILISGNDTYGSVGELSRSDVNMVVTVNPLTSTVLLTSIPRDSYVEVLCSAGEACTYGQLDKITHTGIYGMNTTKLTVENLLDIDINYTFRVNFSSVTDIVDALGGVDVYVEEGMAVETFYADSTLEGVVEGWNHLNGERALAFARERYAYLDGDNQRVKNQQTVLKAIVDKATSAEILSKYSSLLDTFQNAFETTLTRQEITDFIKYQIQAMPGWTFESYQVSGDGEILYCPSLGDSAYVTVLDFSTVALAHDKIEAVLNGGSADDVTVPESVYASPYTYVYAVPVQSEQEEAIEEETLEQME